MTNILLGSFLPGSNGDPRVLFDQHSDRWFVIVPDFSATATIFLAVSLTDDPTGSWFKTSFHTAQGSDAGRWPDYPTLGVDANGLYTVAYMVGGPGHTIFALDKAALVDSPPYLGTITAFRDLPWEGAIQPAHTYGSPGGEYLISIDSTNALRLRRVNPPLTNPTLSDLGTVSVPAFASPPNAPALGSTTPLNTVGDRLMMSVYRDGSLWTAHTINAGGRAGCRWYEIDPAGASLIQSGLVSDGSLNYFFPSIMVNGNGEVAMAFSGSDANQYAGCYYTGRIPSDPPGEMGPPVQYKEGTGPQNNVDGYGRNRWGDYSYTTLDPSDDATFWTVQEYGHGVDIWGTYIAILNYGPPDCNDNGVPDDEDILNGTSEDCNENTVPDECEPDQADCNDNGVLDFCEFYEGTAQDCNDNGIIDECDIDSGLSDDCQPNGIPDECEVGTTPVVIPFDLSTDPGWTTQGLWEYGQPIGGGGAHGSPDPTSGYSGLFVYGYNLDGDYETDLPERHLTTSAIDCSNLDHVTLSFWRWLGVEQPAYDHAYVRVSNGDGTWVQVWTNPAEVADASWQQVEYDISAVADRQSTVYIRWTMGTTDGGWEYCGWNIDDVAVTGDALGGGSGDCNANAIPDACDIASGTSDDANGNGIPDECEAGCPEDLAPPAGVEQQDLNAVLNRWGDTDCLPGGAHYPCPEDLVAPDGVEQQDLNAVLNRWGDAECET